MTKIELKFVDRFEIFYNPHFNAIEIQLDMLANESNFYGILKLVQKIY